MNILDVEFEEDIIAMEEGHVYRSKRKVNGKYWYVMPYSLQYSMSNGIKRKK